MVAWLSGKIFRAAGLKKDERKYSRGGGLAGQYLFVKLL
jgi:hypothetical protein